MLEHGIAPATGGYEIANSLRFNDDDSAYLSRTPSSAGNRKTFTWSGWVKRGNLVNGSFFQVKGSGDFLVYKFNGDDILLQLGAGAVNPQFTTGAKFRDTSAWYHIFVAVDTTQATEADRTKLWINGVQYTLSNGGSSLPQNYDTLVNSTNEHSLGRFTYINSENLDGYLAEVHFIDGQALDPSNFGETGDYGEWKPIEYTGTYGTNGFYLDFKNSGSLGADSSGNGNNWTPNNLAATDQMLDSPTNNFATLNPLVPQNVYGGCSGTGGTLYEGNLKGTSAVGQWNSFVSTFAMDSTDSYYWEVYINSVGTSNDVQLGVQITDVSASHVAINSNGNYVAGDVLGFSFGNGNLKWYRNGTLQTTLSSSLSGLYYIERAVANSGSVTYNFGQDSSFAGNKIAQGNTDGNGYGDFYYAPPTGYLALCTQNLPDPAVIPSEHFTAHLHTGNGTAGHSITGIGFQPDWVWGKNRSSAISHQLYDAVRGATKYLASNATGAESNVSGVTSFDSDGFTLGSDGGLNGNGNAIVTWNWKANGSGVSNTDGTITSTVSANVNAGFSIVKYTGNKSGAVESIGHGLSKAPEIIIQKTMQTGTQGVNGWLMGGTLLGQGSYVFLNTTAAKATASTYWGNTLPDATRFYVGTSSWVGNDLNIEHINYCFHSVDGFSKVGSYTGNGSTDGTFVYTGFRPAYVMLKVTSVANRWVVLDNERPDYNPPTTEINPDSSSAEFGSTANMDFLSNGFKLRRTGDVFNTNGYNYIYIAFAENPFKHTNAR